MDKSSSKSCKIWAIGGGKGGVGKSFVLSSIGMSLAKEGRVVMVDADLGGANLHNFLGITRPKTTLSDFFEHKTPLSELITETGVENLGLITGVIGSLGAESIKFAQKRKLFTHIKKIEADPMRFYPIARQAREVFSQFIAELLAEDIKAKTAGASESFCRARRRQSAAV